ncbi:MAG: CO dehydrogenase/acetyl-CoA synthase complex subunit alpha [Candidatus Nezhaarchaeota archaeon]|nr:CO dehydrogenase/acetyl-CoA synthase complex subunit alpha [Candidatus Nezhaarchaeota archaeon]
MSEKWPLKVSAKEITSGLLHAKDVEVMIGRLAMEEAWEPIGPTPFPHVSTLRSWDHKLLGRYKPFYAPFCDYCCLCTYGKCDLSKGKLGACGLDLKAQQGRIVLLACCIGAATHTSHARHMVDHLIEKYGHDFPINLGQDIAVEMPHARLITGVKPKTLGDLAYLLNYCEQQITQCLSATHTGQEGSYIDFESKALHVGMIDHLSMEIADVAQIVAFNFPKGDPNAPLTWLGLGVLDLRKPVVLCIGHNVSAGIEVIEYLEKSGLGGPGQTVDIGGLCCTAHDITRYRDQAKVVGPISDQLRIIRSGAADAIMTDEQCIRTNVLFEAQRVKTPLIATSDKASYGLMDVSDLPVEKIVEMLVSGSVPGVYLPDLEKAGAVVAVTAIRMAPIRQKFKIIPDTSQIQSAASKCTLCGTCRRNCPIDLPVDQAVFNAKKGSFDMLAALHDVCLGCARCEQVCPQKIAPLTLIEAAAQAKIKTEKYLMRVGRGPILDTEIREVGSPIVLGEIPGVVAYVGCANFPNGGMEVALMAREFARRGFIVTLSGCSAMVASYYRNEEGKTIYEEFPGSFDRGGVVNVGSCVANAHITGAAIKIANIFARRPLRANYEEIADYILNRVGAVGVAWGAYSQKAASIATGCNRLGIPVIVGPQGSKYRRMYLGKAEDRDSFTVYDARTGEQSWVGPVPEHLIIALENMNECMVWTAKLCIRPNDTTKGRMIKLTHYVDLYKRIYGRLPPDLQMFVRTEADIPITFKDEVVQHLKEVGWKPWEKPSVDPTLLRRLVRV